MDLFRGFRKNRNRSKRCKSGWGITSEVLNSVARVQNKTGARKKLQRGRGVGETVGKENYFDLIGLFWQVLFHLPSPHPSPPPPLRIFLCPSPTSKGILLENRWECLHQMEKKHCNLLWIQQSQIKPIEILGRLRATKHMAFCLITVTLSTFLHLSLHTV